MISLGIPLKNIIFEDDILTAYREALTLIKEEDSYRAIVICGSFYEISKFRTLISENNM